MFEIRQTGFSQSIYSDTEYTYDIQTDLNWIQVEEKAKEWLKENHFPTRNYGEWKLQNKDPAVYFSGYYRLCERKMGGWNLHITIPSAE